MDPARKELGNDFDEVGDHRDDLITDVPGPREEMAFVSAVGGWLRRIASVSWEALEHLGVWGYRRS